MIRKCELNRLRRLTGKWIVELSNAQDAIRERNAEATDGLFEQRIADTLSVLEQHWPELIDGFKANLLANHTASRDAAIAPNPLAGVHKLRK